MRKLRAIVANRWTRRGALTLVVLCIIAGSIELSLRSDWFAEAVRTRLVAELELATGGTASIERFRFGRDRLAFIVEGIELRGTEASEDPALLSIARLALEIRIESLIGRRISLEHLNVIEPRASILVFDDGSTNVPSPGTRSSDNDSAPSPVQPLLDLAIKQLQIANGTLDWNGRPYQASVRASEVTLATVFHPGIPEYEVRAEVGQVNWNFSTVANLPTSLAIDAVFGASTIRLTRFDAANDAISLEATGTVADLRQPTFTADYQVNSRISALLRALGTSAPSLSGGLKVDGSLDWQSAPESLSYAGQISATGVSVEGSEDTLAGRASYRGDQTRVALPDVRLTALEGEVSGNVQISDLSGTPRVAISGAATNFLVSRLAAIAGAGYLPWEGLIQGEFEAEGSSIRDLAAQANFNIETAPTPGRYPIQGAGELRYDGATGQLDVPAIRLQSPDAALNLSGLLTAASRAALNVRLELSALDEVVTVLRSLGVGMETPTLGPAGKVRIDGRLTGSLRAAETLSFDGKLNAQDFSIREQSWESLSAEARVTPSGANIRAARISDGEGAIEVRGRVPFHPSGDLSAKVVGQGLNAGKLAEAVGFEFPVVGTLQANLDATGSLAELQLAGDLTMVELEVAGEPFDRLTAVADFGENGFLLRDALLTRGAATLRATAAFAPDSKEFEFSLDSTGWPLEEFAFMRGQPTPLTGVVRFDLLGAGRQGLGEQLFRSLNLTGSWAATELQRNGQELGSWTGDIRTADDEIHVKWLAAMLDGEASGESVLTPVGHAGYSGSVQFKNFGTQAVAELLDLPLSKLEGQIDGQAEYSGELGAPDEFKISGTVDRFEAGLSGIGSSAAGYRVSNLFPMRWTFEDDLVRLDSMTLNGSGTDVEIDGTIALAGERAIDVGVEGRFNLILLEGFDANIDAAGTSNLNIQVGGTVDDIAVEGSMAIVAGTLRSADFPNGLSDINGQVDFSGRQMKIDELTATSGGGTLRLSGVTIFGEDGTEYRLRAAAERVRMRYPANISSVFDGQLTLAGTGNRTILNGEVIVSRLSTAKGLTFGDLFASFRQPARTQAAGSALQNVQLNVSVVSIPNLAIDTNLVRNVEAEINLKVVGTAASPSLLGDVGITQGTLHMFGTRYHVNRGDVRFVNPFRIEPLLNVELETRIRDVDLALVLSGPARRLNLSYRSDPPLPFNDLVNLVAVGRAPTVDPVLASRQRVEQQSLIQTGANNVLASTLARPVSQRLQRFFGVSRLKVDPQIGGPEANPSARISTEQQITNDLTLTYSYDLSSAQQQVVRVEWAPNRRWSFIVTRDENGLVGSDFLYKTRLP